MRIFAACALAVFVVGVALSLWQAMAAGAILFALAALERKGSP